TGDDSGTVVKTIIVDTEDSGDSDKLHFISKDGSKPLIFIDGKKASEKEMKALNPDQIESINVFKGDKAIEKHGKKAGDGVIEITTKKE
ncbi:MAG: M56 family peptidase, partial [Robiginitalea sp.]